MNPLQRKELHAALLSAFPNAEDLELLVGLSLGTTLDQISPDAPLAHRVLKVIEWAESEDRVDTLVDDAFAQRPNNSLLVAYRKKWPSIPPDEETPPTPRPAPYPTPRPAPDREDRSVRLLLSASGFFSVLTFNAIVCATWPSPTVAIAGMVTLVAALAVLGWQLKHN